MEQGPFQDRLGGTVEVDETYIGGKARNRVKRYRQPSTGGRPKDKAPVVALVERDGRVRSERVANVTSKELHGAIHRHVDREARIITDSFSSYRGLYRDFAGHEMINHADDEWVRGDVHTNTVESFFAILKRGINGVYHHVSETHLPRYLAEFDFRYNTRVAAGYSDVERTRIALGQTGGKRLTYRETRD